MQNIDENKLNNPKHHLLWVLSLMVSVGLLSHGLQTFTSQASGYIDGLSLTLLSFFLASFAIVFHLGHAALNDGFSVHPMTVLNSPSISINNLVAAIGLSLLSQSPEFRFLPFIAIAASELFVAGKSDWLVQRFFAQQVVSVESHDNLNENSDEDTEEELEPMNQALPLNTTQSLTRHVYEGYESIKGQIRVRFSATERTSVVHVPFWPPLENPEAECFVIEGEGSAEAINIQPLGARIEVKRTPTNRSGWSTIAFEFVAAIESKANPTSNDRLLKAS